MTSSRWRDPEFLLPVAAGVALGLFGVLLAWWGNPRNSGICISCFLENSAGALGLHDNPRMQYLRPELLGFVLGAFFAAAGAREFRSRGGNSPLLHLFSGVFLMVGCAVFVGCPIKLVLRLTAGDWTALAGAAGLLAGVWTGLKGLAAGVELVLPGRKEGRGGLMMPVTAAALLVLFLLRPGFLLFSARGSAAEHAPWLLALGSGLVIGALAQRSRFCLTGSLRDLLLFGRRSPLGWGMAAFLVTSGVANGVLGSFQAGWYGQPGAHLEVLWSFLGMGLVGWISILIGGCPFRQLIRAGEGDSDAGAVLVGMLLGGALVQSWDLAGSAAGVPLYGKIAVLCGFLFVLAGSLLYRQRGGAAHLS